MSIWDNVKKFTQPYNDDEYDEYDEDDEYMDDYEEAEEKPRRNARAGRGARRMNPFREPEREREAAPAPAQEEDDYEEYARKVIGRAYFIVLNKIDELDGTNEKLFKYYQEYIEKCIKL